MKPVLRNTLWFVAFPIVGALAAFVAMGLALGGGLELSASNATYSVVRGLVAGFLTGLVFLLFWVCNRMASTNARLVELAAFSVGWFLAFYIYIAALAAV